MSRSVSPSRVVIAVGAMAGALALAGCGAGQITQTSTQVSGVDGGSANVGQIAVRGAEFAFTGNGRSAVIYPAGGTAPLTMSVINTGAQPDRLMAVASPVAGSGRIVGDATISGGYELLVGGRPAAPAAASATAPAAPAGPTPRAGARPTPSVSAAAPTSAAAAPTSQAAAPSGAATVPTSEAAAANNTGPSANGTTTAQVVLSGLKQDLQAGLTYPVVLSFQRAGDVTVQVPVGNPGEGSPSE